MKTRPAQTKKGDRRLAAVGISNRESPAEEARDRKAHPPVDAASPPPEDAGGAIGEGDYSRRGRQTSHKAGSRSVAQKEAGSKYADRSAPSTRKVSGAFARESQKAADRDRTASLHQARPAKAAAGRSSRRRSA